MMSKLKQNVESILFDYKTITNTDYREHEFEPYVETVCKSKIQPSLKKSTELLKYVHTMSDWKQVMPFDTMMERKEIVRTNPHQVQAAFEKSPDLEMDTVRKTRPHSIMTPAVNVDSVDAKTYALLVNDKYTTHTMKEFGNKYAIPNISVPLNGKYAPTMPMALPKLAPPLVAPEWRMESASWDRRQRRDYCDATKLFWLNKGQKKHQKSI